MAIVRPILIVVLGPFALYLGFLAISATPFFQRHFVYAHKIHTLWWNDVREPQTWGFAKNQVTPFSLHTDDHETLFTWHIVPLPLYLQYEDKLSAQPEGFVDDFTKTENFKMLKDPNVRLVISFHGNAGHVAQAWRPNSYHTLTDTSSYHVLAIDYRGFGHSTGSPSEDGLISDGVAVVDWAMNVAEVPSSKIVLMGQSLGTAVASGVADHYSRKGIEFAGIVLIAGFSHLPTMLTNYAIGGFLPVLAPLRLFPAALSLIQRFVVDKWHSAERLASVVKSTNSRLRLFLVHAYNDRDIPCNESNLLFKAVALATPSGRILSDAEFEDQKAQRTVVRARNAFVATWKDEPNIVIRQEQFGYGGHNDIVMMAPVALAIMRAFDLEGTVYH